MRGFALALAMVVALLGGCGEGDAPSPQPVTPVASPTPTPGVLRTPPGIFLLPGQRGTYAHEQMLVAYADGFPAHAPAALHVISEGEGRLLFSLAGETDAAGKLFAFLPVEAEGPYAMPLGEHRLEVSAGGRTVTFSVTVGSRPGRYDLQGCDAWPKTLRPGEEAVLFCVGGPGALWRIQGPWGTQSGRADVAGLWVFLALPETSVRYTVSSDRGDTFEIPLQVEGEP